MDFNPDPSKQAQDVISSRKLQKKNHNQVYFNHNYVKQVPSRKHFGMYLDTKLNFQEHLDNVLSKVNKTTELLHKLTAPVFSCGIYIIYKTPSFISQSFQQKME